MRNPEQLGRLCSLLDKLAAIQIDLKPLCAVHAAGSESVPSRGDIIAGVCQILAAAIGDVRDVIRKLDGPDEPTQYRCAVSPGTQSAASIAL